ncbi:hypothetical protein HW115_04555 [Verrucomicrobiaceae bacterium N1E253]|uniref:Uncharacterized protein n=1 Tax=Oceaniferula marina TaxID=2748318 RepID=A0A851GIB3_9BACT|nr:hypothetical protein [Oceaniferula marina]NWK54867.1 hypothetical protein [Oceaniferula marina]
MNNSKEQDKTASKPHGSAGQRAYPWLLALSVCFSGVLCWLYVTKPVIVSSGEVQAQGSSAPSKGVLSSGGGSENSKSSGPSDLLPSDDALPGMAGKKAAGKGSAISGGAGSPKPLDPRKLATAGDGSGWEKTNARVQHILSADAGDGEIAKIVLNVPVIYETRTMRWTQTDIQQARDILGRLMVYESNLARVKQEGNALLSDWNKLLEKTVPAGSLRADSPSLPYNHSQRSSGEGLPDSGSTIKIEP